MPQVKVTGAFPKSFKGVTIRLDKDVEIRMDVTPTQGSSGPSAGLAENDTTVEPTPDAAVQGAVDGVEQGVNDGVAHVSEVPPDTQVGHDTQVSRDTQVEVSCDSQVAPVCQVAPDTQVASDTQVAPNSQALLPKMVRKSTVKRKLKAVSTYVDKVDVVHVDNSDDDFVDPHASKSPNVLPRVTRSASKAASKSAAAPNVVPTLRHTKKARSEDVVKDVISNAGASTRKGNIPNVASTHASSSKKKARIEEVKGNNYCTIRCAPSSIASIVGNMTQPMKDRLKAIGFGEILKFKFDAIGDRDLAMFVMDCIKVDPPQIVVGNIELPLSPDVFHSVLGLPIGGDPLPMLSASERSKFQADLRDACEQHGMKDLYPDRVKQFPQTKAYGALKPHEVPRWVVEFFASKKDADDWTLRCFLLTLFNALLFPTSNLDVLGQEYFYSLDFEKVGKYDWCKGVMDDFIAKVSKFKMNAKTPSVQGCIVVPLIYYLDCKQCPPHSLTDDTSRPRAAVFHGTRVESIANADWKGYAYGRKTYGKLAFRDEAMTCYKKISEIPCTCSLCLNSEERVDEPAPESFVVHDGPSSTSQQPAAGNHGHRDDAFACDRQTDTSASVSWHLGPLFKDMFADIIDDARRNKIMAAFECHDFMMDVAHANVEKGQKMLCEGKAMLQSAHLLLQSGEKLLSDGKVMIQEAQSKFVVEVKKIIGSCAQDLQDFPKGNASNSIDDEVPVDKDEQCSQAIANDGLVSEDFRPQSSPLAPHTSIGLSETAVLDGNTCQGDDIRKEDDKDGQHVLNPKNDAPVTVGQGDSSKSTDISKSDDRNVAMKRAINESLDEPEKSLSGVLEKNHDIDHWHIVSSVLREIPDAYADISADQFAERSSALNVEISHIVDEATTDDQNLVDNVVMPEPSVEKAINTITRKARGLRKHKLLFEVPMELGADVQVLQIGQGATTGGSKFQSPFKAPMFRRKVPDLLKSMKFRAVIIESVEKLRNEIILLTKEEYRSEGLDCCLSFTSDVVASFGDNMMIGSKFVHFFTLCLLADEKESRPTCAGYRLFLPGFLSDTVLYEKYNCSPYDHGVAVDIFEQHYNVDDLLDAKLIFFPIIHEGIWTIYCVNLVHGQIDILDPVAWDSMKQQRGYHGSFAGRIRARLHKILKSYTDARFPDISKWGMPFIEGLPKQLHEYDSGCFAMLFMEHYDGENRKMDITISSDMVSQYRAQNLHYMAFHKINEAASKFPPELKRLAPNCLFPVHMEAL